MVLGSIDPGIALNRFAFANADPVDAIDPLGLYADFDGAGHATYKFDPYGNLSVSGSLLDSNGVSLLPNAAEVEYYNALNRARTCSLVGKSHYDDGMFAWAIAVGANDPVKGSDIARGLALGGTLGLFVGPLGEAPEVAEFGAFEQVGLAADRAVTTAGGAATQLEFNFANEFGQNSGLVIGRGADLSVPDALGPGEYKLGWFSVQGTSGMEAEWSVNQMKLENVMNLNLPIRDASSLLDTGGYYLNQERGLLQSTGWTYQGGYWVPPAQ